MAVFRIEKTRDYTVMSNHHLRDMSLSLKAKGLLSLMLSLPENWDYTMKGLSRICKDGIDSISGGIRELEEHGYLIRERVRGANGQLGSIEYTILEQPKPDATHEEVVRAAKSACCHDFIMALPNGYDTVIGESGATLSGGEKQRISIARAILKDTPIIILDEATSSVDPENEAELQQAIEKLTEDKTVIIIAHRLKTVRNAQQIVVIANGGIAQRGTHQELMTQPGIYADFVNIREKAVNWKISSSKIQQ